MNLRKVVFIPVILISVFLTGAYSDKAASVATASVQPFLGRWDLTLTAPDREYPSWLEISEEDGALKARMVSRWGHARPLPKIELSNGILTFVSPKEEEDRKTDMVFEGRLSGNTLSGTTTGPDGTPWQWTGTRAPSLPRTRAPKWGKAIRLFNGQDLTGWKMQDPNAAATWKVENGTLVSPGHGPELSTNPSFKISSCMSNSTVRPMPTVASICAVATRYKLKPTLFRNRRVIIPAECMVS